MCGQGETGLGRQKGWTVGRKNQKENPAFSSAYSIFGRPHASPKVLFPCSQAAIQNILPGVCRQPFSPLALSTAPRGHHPSFLALPPSLSCPIHFLGRLPQHLALCFREGPQLSETDSEHISQSRRVLGGVPYTLGDMDTIGFEELSLGELGDVQAMLNFRRFAE